jgi:hypothetical protein
MRVKYWTSSCLLLGLFILIGGFADKKPLDYRYLVLICGIAFVLAILECRAMWTLKARRVPVWRGAIYYVVAILAVASLCLAHYTGIFTWNIQYLLVPAVLIMIPEVIVSWLTEWRKSVNIYWELEGTWFLPRTSGVPISDQAIAVGFGLAAIWLGFVLFYDEPRDPGSDAFYLQTQPTVPDAMNAAIGLEGLAAPQGTDVIAFGRFAVDTYARNDLTQAQSRKVIEDCGVLVFAKNPGELDCMSWPEPDYPTAPCPTAARLSALLGENAELLQRYRQVVGLPDYQPPRFGGNAQIFIDLNKLIAEEIAFELRRGNTEAAYQKWRNNYTFLSKAAYAEDSWVGKAIVLVNEGLSHISVELLLHEAPELVDAHGDELLRLLRPVGLSRWNLEGVMRAEYRLLDPIISSGNNQFWVHPDFIRNRYFRAAKAFLDISAGHPSHFGEDFESGRQVHGKFNEWTWDYVRNPLNTVFARGMLGGQFKAWPLVTNMVQKDGRLRLLTLRILLARNKIAGRDVDRFLSSQPTGLRDPFTDQPMRWNSERQVIWFCQPGHAGNVTQVRLPGGKWLDDPAKECGEKDRAGPSTP